MVTTARTCTTDGCDRTVKARGLCNRHYKEANPRKCTIQGCDERHEGRGYCNRHLLKYRKYGDPLAGYEIDQAATPEARFWAKVNKRGEAECWEWTGSTNNGYGHLGIDGKMYKAHRYAWMLTNGGIPAGMHLDHRCFNTRCVNPDHLRVVTPKQNSEHHRGPNKGNRGSGVRGVYRAGSKWVASFRHNNENQYLGTFSTVEEAEAAVVAARKEVFTHDDADEWRERATA